MTHSVKDKIQADLQRAKSEGQLRAERIQEITRSAASQAMGEIKAGTVEVRSIVKETIALLLENLKGRGQDVQEEVTAGVRGLLEGISASKREQIVKTEAEIQQLQTQLDQQETALQTELDTTIAEIQTASNDAPSDLKSALNDVVANLKDTEEVALLQKRYAQLQTQLAVLRANLTARYGDRFDEAKVHLDNAKVWYESAKEKAATGEPHPIDRKQKEIETKMGEAGSALARKERQVKQLLKELWQTVSNS